MHERMGHGEVDRRGGGSAGRERRGVVRPGRRPARGPRPIRPGAAPVAVRPPEVPRPAVGSGGGVGAHPVGVWRDGSAGLRLLARRPVAVRVRRGVRYRLRRVVAGFAVVVVSAAAVVALGLLARAAGPEAVAPRTASAVVLPSAPAVVTVAPGETVWEVAARLAPGRPGPEVAALAERIVIENALGSARLRPGQVLRVAAG